MLERIIGTSTENGYWPAGWYCSEQRGDHELKYIHTIYYGNNKDEKDLPPFTYWRDKFPEDENILPW